MVIKVFTTVFFVFINVATSFSAVPSYNKKLDITYKKLIFDNVEISMSENATTMSPFKVFFEFKDPSTISNITFTVDMINMKMGPFKKIPILNKSNNLYYVELILPQCRSGHTLWYGILTYNINNKPYSNYIFMNLIKVNK